MKLTLLNSKTMLRSGAAFDDLELQLLYHDGTVCFDRIAAVDYTSALTLLTLGIKQATSEFLIQSFVTPGAGFVCSNVGRLFVPALCRPFVRVTGGVLGDILELFVFGYLEYSTVIEVT